MNGNIGGRDGFGLLGFSALRGFRVASTGPKPAERRGSGARPAPSRPFPASSALRPELLDADAEVTGPGQRSAASVPSARCAQGFQAACRWQGGRRRPPVRRAGPREAGGQRGCSCACLPLGRPPHPGPSWAREKATSRLAWCMVSLGRARGLLAPHAPFWKLWGCNEPRCARSFLEPLKP